MIAAADHAPLQGNFARPPKQLPQRVIQHSEFPGSIFS
jgi:hypothetical protein